MRIGVLAVQGDFIEHASVLRQLETEALPVRLPQELDGLDGLIIPGGESTTISRLMLSYGLTQAIRDLARDGLPILGTCAGMILLAKSVHELGMEPIGAMDIEVRRNAFGRQVDSFETDLAIPALGQEPFHAVFIRAPLVEGASPEVEILAKVDSGAGVAARQGKLVVSAFHPELTDDPRFHAYFLNIVDAG
jgi:5'-phosphate synthase pdxT subunit